MSTTGPPRVRKLWQGKKLVPVDVLKSMQLIYWAYGRAERVNAVDARHLRNLADTALSGLLLVLKQRVGPVPMPVYDALAALNQKREGAKAA